MLLLSFFDSLNSILFDMKTIFLKSKTVFILFDMSSTFSKNFSISIEKIGPVSSTEDSFSFLKTTSSLVFLIGLPYISGL